MSTASPAPGVSSRATVAIAALILICSALGGIPPALAHHAFAAEYDSDKPIVVTGTVTKAKWVNPHSRLFLDVKNPDGTITNWGFEFGAPNSLSRDGLKKADLKPGTQVHIQGFRSKNGGPYGYSVVLTLADGRSFRTGSAPDAPPPPPSAQNATHTPAAK